MVSPTSQTTGTREAELEEKLSAIGSNEQALAAQALATRLGLPFLDLKAITIDPDALRQVPEATAKSAMSTLVQLSGNKGVVVTVNPETPAAATLIKDLGSRYTISVVVVSPATMTVVLTRYDTIRTTEVFEVGSIRLDDAALAVAQAHIKNITDLQQELQQSTITKLFEIIVAGGLATKASDIHLEAEADRLRIRYRLDGLLHDAATLDKQSHKRLVNRIKVLTKMKLNVTKAPQDGRFTIHQSAIDIEIRVSVLPGEYGESVVMRLLDPRTIQTKLDDLGMRAEVREQVKELMAKPQGMLLTTGPTGSGKTTTLYALVNELNTPDAKIITIEDPVEYHIAGINQTQVEPDKGYSFETGLRSIVRQDPDIILVGEIRDLETAEIALNAALTGHLVLSTIHTNDAAGTIPRFIEIGVRPESIGPALTMAMGQRLVRRLCQNCKKKLPASAADVKTIQASLQPLQKRLNIPPITEQTPLYGPVGCEECNGTGYRGRVGVYEIFRVTPAMERLIISKPTVSDVRDLAIKDGMITMYQDGYLKLLDGVTSLEEIRRVLG